MRSETDSRGRGTIGLPVWGIDNDGIYYLMGIDSNDDAITPYSEWRKFDLEFAMELVRRSCRQHEHEFIEVRGVLITPELALPLWMRGEITNRDVRTSSYTPYVGNPWLVMPDFFGDELDLVVARPEFNVFDVLIYNPRNEYYTRVRVEDHDLPGLSFKGVR